MSFLTFDQVGTSSPGERVAVGGFLPLTAVLFYLAVSVFFIIDPLRHIRLRRARPASLDEGKAPDIDASGVS